MKRLLLASLIVAAIVIPGLRLVANADKPAVERLDDLFYLDLVALHAAPTTSGPDAYGFDYASRSFEGYLPNLYLGAMGLEPYTGDRHAFEMAHPTIVRAWFWQFCDVRASLTWDEAFLSTEDADGDGWLDRHAGAKGYVGSGAWVSAEMAGDGWMVQVRVIAAPERAEEKSGAWRTASGTVLGPAVWDGFAAAQITSHGEGAGPAGAALLAHMP